MSVDRSIEVVLGVAMAIVAYMTFVMATRTTRIQEKASIRNVDAAAFDRAEQIYKGALDTLREELVACRAELATNRSDLASARNEIGGLRADLAGARSEITSARNEIARLTADIARLRDKDER